MRSRYQYGRRKYMKVQLFHWAYPRLAKRDDIYASCCIKLFQMRLGYYLDERWPDLLSKNWVLKCRKIKIYWVV